MDHHVARVDGYDQVHDSTTIVFLSFRHPFQQKQSLSARSFFRLFNELLQMKGFPNNSYAYESHLTYFVPQTGRWYLHVVKCIHCGHCY